MSLTQELDVLNGHRSSTAWLMRALEVRGCSPHLAAQVCRALTTCPALVQPLQRAPAHLTEVKAQAAVQTPRISRRSPREPQTPGPKEEAGHR